MRITTRTRTWTVGDRTCQLTRRADGTVEISGDREEDLALGLGLAHATDRPVQLLLTRLVGQGRLSEHLRADEDALAIDRFARELGFAGVAAREAANLSTAARLWLEAYCAGVHEGLRRGGTPWELRLLRYTPDPWQPADALLIYLLMSYVGLAQAQQDAEKLFLSAAQAGVDPARLKALLSPHYDELSEEILGLLQRVTLYPSALPQAVRFAAGIPALLASNNWAIAGHRTASGGALLCADPHLEINRLPAIWYEVVQRLPHDTRIGITVPGLPALVMGRSQTVAYSFTYGFMDQLDYFLEDVRDGRCRRDGDPGEGVPLRCREEVIRRQGAPAQTLRLWETPLGTLELPTDLSAVPDGLYLCRAWSGLLPHATAESFRAFHDALAAQRVPDLQAALRTISLSANWLLADTEGHIGYQQSGALPQRRGAGLVPLPAWRPDNPWQGRVDPRQLRAELDPPEGFLVTANDDWNAPGGPLTINLPMGAWRAARIRSVLEGLRPALASDMMALQRDLYSAQAEHYMARLRPLLPHTPPGEILRSWDLRYTADSRGATLFEEIYRLLLEQVIGEDFLGRAAWRSLVEETATLVDLHTLFDRALLHGEETLWFGHAGGRTARFQQVVETVCRRYPTSEAVPSWGSLQQFTMKHLLFGGQLPSWAGFDRGPFALEGGRATVCQGSLYRSGGRVTTFAPSWRMVADLAEPYAWTTLAGGVSERRASPHYASDLRRWRSGDHKRLP